MKKATFTAIFILLFIQLQAQTTWKLVSSLNGDIDMPNGGNQQTCSVVADFDNDGHPDIWYAEMRLNGGNPTSQNKILFGDGKGNFPREMIISVGVDNHESKIADLDGDGDFDILGKGYDQLGGNLNIWLQNGTGKRKK
ncbi:VCBS repeat-containing protein [Parabacteroides sp. AM08-6]|uniref:FG-GAP repeat domain-containing protein n=1 Tax=Parabacteroides sp. AM08-6 TaxID=2292053 RepID=UPI000F00510F|nr:VCBS repeat-containing protein [Parabacteroides sp. AM08-6]RHJ82901.1 VCBS repeat-containing protein [Parabacteroides sp. AM08-6]